MRRLYCLLPDIESSKAVVSELEESGIPERHLHAIAGLAQDIDDLPRAGLLQKTELLHGLVLGSLLGLLAGFLGGLLVMNFPPAGLVLGRETVVVCSIAGAVLGAAVSTLISSHEHSHQLDAFEEAIEEGQILLMVDIAAGKVAQTKKMILSHHPEAEIRETARPKR